MDDGKALTMTAQAKHEPAYRVPLIFKDGASRCTCGWQSKVATPTRANGALATHITRTAR